MTRQRTTIRLAILLLLLGTTMAWSQRTHKRKPSDRDAEDTAAESKISSRYSHEPRSSSHYMDGHEHYPKVGGGGHAEEYVDSEEQKSEREQDEAMGKAESDDTVKNDQYHDNSEKGGDREFKAGGSSFDKHLKDHKADNKEMENVKEHDEGAKFGGEATKEHKLGKHKEKSKGHKLHGFKNVYHKEEYGDHKTFHDEFLDNDHHHNYDDHHEHKEVHGGKFSKGFKHEGKNKKYDKGDEKHEWGKEEYDGHHEGKHEKGKQSSKHRHGSKKHQGQYEANSHRNKNSVHKVKKGDPPIHIPHGGHGPHQAQIEPVVSHYSPPQEPVHVQSYHYTPHSHKQSHPVHYDDDDGKISSNDDHESHLHDSHDDHHGSRHHSNHGGHHDEEPFSQEDDHDDDDDYAERTARNHKHRSSAKHHHLDDKSDEKFTPISKYEPLEVRTLHKNEPVVQRNEPVVYRSEPVVQRKESVVSKFEPVMRKYEPAVSKYEPIVSKFEPFVNKQSVSSNYGTHQYRQPVYQESSRLKPSEPVKQMKYSHSPNGRSHDHNQRIRYGYQPRTLNSHNHHHNNHRNHHNHHSHHHHQQPLLRYPGFNHHHHQGRVHHHHHDGHKNHSHFRLAPSNYHQQQSKLNAYVPLSTQTSSVKPVKSEDYRRYSQRLQK